MHKSFSKLSEEYIHDADATIIKLVHKKTGAQVLYHKCEDKNKAFCIGFKTLINDNTGVAHILEHSVLNGSAKYPVKEPFAYLVKNSLQTYLNASTYPDKTIYPVSSINQKELVNMAGVYLDSVFSPNLTLNTFMQEGWRYDVAETGDLFYSGVVFNEMKGSFANSDLFVASNVQRDVLAGTDYAFDAGGIPSAIPTLTYENFRAFHAKYYHPSNSYTLLYGDLDPVVFLELLDSYFSQYEKQEGTFALKELPKLSAPKTVEHTYQAPVDNTHVSVVSWAFDQVDARDFFGLMVLHYLLITSDASPLKKYLLDKGLGTSLFVYGYESDILLNFFAVGLKGISNLEKVIQTEEAITTFFSELAKGIDREQLRGAVNRIEFMTRSDASSENSKGVELYAFLLKYWLYGKDPVALLEYSNYFDFFKRNALETQYFENLVSKYIVDNTYCVRSRFAPDPELFASEELAEQAKLIEIRHGLTKSELDAIVKKNEELKLEQATPDTQTSLDTLPMLSIADVSQEVSPYPCSIEDDGQTIYTQIPDKKMVHLLLSFDISHVEPRDLPYLALFAKTFFKLGTLGKSEDKFTSELEEVTGELSARLLFTSDLITNKKHRKLVVKVSFLEPNLDRTLALLEEGLLHANFNNTARLKKLMDEYRVGMGSDLVESGHRFALRNSLASLSQEQYLWDITSGVSFYKFLQQVIGEFNTATLRITSKADVIRTAVSRSSLQISLSCSKGFKKRALRQLSDFKARLPFRNFPHSVDIVLPKASKTFYTIPSKVNYVASSMTIATTFNDFGGLNYLLRGILQYDYLWNEIRVKGGAYGGIAYCLEDGLLGCVSYRDPNLEKTLQVYRQVPNFLTDFVATDKVLTGYKIGALSDLEPYIDNDSLGAENYIKYLTGQTQAVRQAMKDKLLTATQETISNVGNLMDSKSSSNGSITVLGNITTIQDKAYFDSIEQLA